MTRRTGFLWHELYAWHSTPPFAGYVPFGNPVQPGEHAENPETKRRLRNLLEVSGLLKSLVPIEPRPATEAELLRFHTAEHVAHIRAQSELIHAEGGLTAPLGRGSYEIALLAAGGVIQAVDAVLEGTVDNAYALVRPPGHHAEANRAMGFCLFNNAVLAGLHALTVRGLERIAYVDWDVHHGNGTQAAFWEDPRALTISLHQDRNFPVDTGLLSEIGAGAGEGYNINVPLPPGSGTGAYEAAFERVVLPALERFRPQLIMVPCGFDAGAEDPLGRMMLTGSCYRSLTRQLLAAADRLCGGRIVMSHEGGYGAHIVPFFGLAVIEELCGTHTGVQDPFEPFFSRLGQQELQPHQDALIRSAEALLSRLP